MNYILLIISALGTVCWAAKIAMSKTIWGAIGAMLLGTYCLIMTCAYVFMILITALGI